VVAQAEFGESVAEEVGAVAVTVVGEQAANGDAVLGIESDGGAQEGDGGVGFLVGEHAGEGEAGVIVNGDVEGLPAGELRTAAAASIAAQRDALIAGEGFDVEVEQVSRGGMFVAHPGRSRVQMAPAVEMSALQNAADGGGTEMGGLGDLVSGTSWRRKAMT